MAGDKPDLFILFFNCNPLEEVRKIGMGNLFSSAGYEAGYIMGFIIPHTCTTTQQVASLSRSRRPVKVHCPKCKVYVRLDVRNAV